MIYVSACVSRHPSREIREGGFPCMISRAGVSDAVLVSRKWSISDISVIFLVSACVSRHPSREIREGGFPCMISRAGVSDAVLVSRKWSISDISVIYFASNQSLPRWHSTSSSTFRSAAPIIPVFRISSTCCSSPGAVSMRSSS